jgi:hypothetical protein
MEDESCRMMIYWNDGILSFLVEMTEDEGWRMKVAG